MSKKIIIVGGVAGGASAAARLRRLDEKAEIILLERGQYISYANCGLPYYIGGTIEDREALFVQTPEKMSGRFNIDIRVKNEVIKIDTESKSIQIRKVDTEEVYEESYDELILSTGSTPVKPPIKGIDAENIFTLWTVNDTDRIKGYINDKQPKKAVVIGGGFIGLEMVENLVDLGVEVTLVEMQNQVMAPVDFEMAQFVHQELSSKGVHLKLGRAVKAFEHVTETKTKVMLDSGDAIESDLIIMSIGVRPNSQLAKDANIRTNQRGGIVVNEKLQTSADNIYAIGDVIEVKDFINDQPTMIPLAGPANKQGRIVADIINGRDVTYKGSMGTSVAKVFDLTVASTGHNEKQLQQQGLVYDKDYKVTFITPKTHAGYYPGAIPINMKMIFNHKGEILGSQMVGYEDVAKHIDIVATTIRLNGTIYDLTEQELAYAPPYSSAKAPTNMLGFTAENILMDRTTPCLWHEIENLDNSVCLDVREDMERLVGEVPNSIHMPLNNLRNNLEKLPKDKEIIVYCSVGLRGYIAEQILKHDGYKVRNLIGGYNLYRTATNDFMNKDTDGNYEESHESKQEEGSKEGINVANEITIKLNACGLQCPGPIMKVYNKIQEINEGDILEVSASDPGFPIDIKAWCNKTGNTFMKSEKMGNQFVAWIRKGGNALNIQQENTISRDGKTMVVFSGDLDKAIASFIIANGAAAMGKPVTMFFTFWGLNILRKHERISVKKGFMDHMFGKMMPRGSKRLGLSRMNMGGMGAKMIRNVMKNKNVDSLEDLMALAIENGVKVVACTMSMDVMGIKQEELIDGVELGGVAAYLGAADDANVNLFI